jgi:hypothetical protein
MTQGSADFSDASPGLSWTPLDDASRRTAMFIVPRRGSGLVAAFVLLYVLMQVPLPV